MSMSIFSLGAETVASAAPKVATAMSEGEASRTNNLNMGLSDGAPKEKKDDEEKTPPLSISLGSLVQSPLGV